MSVVRATDNNDIDLDSSPQVVHYDASGNPDYVEVTTASGTYRQNLTWTGGKLTAVSAWVKQ